MASYPYQNQNTNAMTEKTAIEDKLFALKQKYLLSLPEKLSDIDEHWSACCETQTLADKALESSLHKLAGSAGMYDENELGEIARSLEISVSNYSETLTPENIKEIDTGLTKLREKVSELIA